MDSPALNRRLDIKYHAFNKMRAARIIELLFLAKFEASFLKTLVINKAILCSI